MSPERDFPVGHPAAGDYAGEAYNPPQAPHSEDFPEGHPARGGKNCSELDTPDGIRAAANKAQRAIADLLDRQPLG
jgi:hypothetical protein